MLSKEGGMVAAFLKELVARFINQISSIGINDETSRICNDLCCVCIILFYDLFTPSADFTLVTQMQMQKQMQRSQHMHCTKSKLQKVFKKYCCVCVYICCKNLECELKENKVSKPEAFDLIKNSIRFKKT